MSIHSFAAPTSVPHAPIYCLLKSQAQRAPKAVAIFAYEMPGEQSGRDSRAIGEGVGRAAANLPPKRTNTVS
jgi:hypothetical protein